MTPALNLNNVSLEYPDGSSTLRHWTPSTSASAGVNSSPSWVLPDPENPPCWPSPRLSSNLRRGLVIIDGQDVSALSEAECTALRRDKVGIIFQQANLLPSLTAVEQLLIREHLRGGKPVRDEREKAAELLNVVGLSGGGTQEATPAVRRPTSKGEHCEGPHGKPNGSSRR